MTRVTVSLPGSLVKEVDRLKHDRNRFVEEAVRHELAQRRRAALLRSVRSPHAHAMALLDTGMADWTADLPDHEGLVDPAGGTPVRWVRNQGWVEGVE